MVDDVVTVMAEFAQLPSEIDVAAAEREQAEAEAVLGSVSDEALAQALAKLETAVTRIQSPRGHGRRSGTREACGARNAGQRWILLPDFSARRLISAPTRFCGQMKP